MGEEVDDSKPDSEEETTVFQRTNDEKTTVGLTNRESDAKQLKFLLDIWRDCLLINR